MVRRGQSYRTAAQQKGASMRSSGRSYRGGYTRSEIKGKKELKNPYPHMFKPKKPKRKFRIEIDRVQTKPSPKHADDLYEAKHKVRGLIDKYPHGLARIKVLKKDGKSYKSKSSHWLAKNRKTGRKRITNL